MYLELARSIEGYQGLLHSLPHCLFALTDPDSGIVVLLVRLVLCAVSAWFSRGARNGTYLSVGVSDLCHEIVLIIEDVLADTI